VQVQSASGKRERVARRPTNQELVAPAAVALGMQRPTQLCEVHVQRPDGIDRRSAVPRFRPSPSLLLGLAAFALGHRAEVSLAFLFLGGGTAESVSWCLVAGTSVPSRWASRWVAGPFRPGLITAGIPFHGWRSEARRGGQEAEDSAVGTDGMTVPSLRIVECGSPGAVGQERVLVGWPAEISWAPIWSVHACAAWP
jgi:hypothetical protein